MKLQYYLFSAAVLVVILTLQCLITLHQFCKDFVNVYLAHVVLMTEFCCRPTTEEQGRRKQLLFHLLCDLVTRRARRQQRASDLTLGLHTTQSWCIKCICDSTYLPVNFVFLPQQRQVVIKDQCGCVQIPLAIQYVM